MPQPKIKSKATGKQNKLVAPANDSYMIGLDPKTIATNARIMKEAAKGPKMKITKDGSAILSPLKQKSVIEKKKMKKSPLKQMGPGPKSKLTDYEKEVEVGAKTDSIEASKPKDWDTYTKTARQILGNNSANKTREINKSSVRVERKESYTPKTGVINSYKMKYIDNNKSPLKQVSALSGKKDKSTVAPKTVAAGVAKRSPILMKKKC